VIVYNLGTGPGPITGAAASFTLTIA